MSTHAPTIRPLPEAVRLRLRSTLNINSLSDAISELVQNSLDAGAKNIKIHANLSRNSCVVEDDGAGIPPMELGMVGKIYATSKYPPPPDSELFGSRGEALAALSANSLLTLTTRHHAHRSTNTIRISYSDAIFNGPALEHLRLPSNGTLVRIEGLWGNMPVRLKARQSEDTEREWEDVKRVLVELLLTSRGKGVSVVAKDENGNRRLVVKAGSNNTDIPWEVGVLGQAYGREVGGSGWEKVKAKQGGVKIEGWICTRGSGTRGHQYLYMNQHPLPPSTTLLHTEINKLFMSSSFGVIDEDPKAKQGSTLASRKVNGPRKSVDRRGMLVLRIECRNCAAGVLGGEGGTDGKSGVEGANLKSVIELLQKLIREFLKTHHFRPSSNISAMTGEKNLDSRSSSGSRSVLGLLQRQPEKEGSRSRSGTPLATIKSNGNSVITNHTNQMGESGRFGTLEGWSRIKRAKLDPKEEEGRSKMGFGKTKRTFSNSPTVTEIEKDNENSSAVTPPSSPEEDSLEQEISLSSDEFVQWTNPVSKKICNVNSRTGHTSALKNPFAKNVRPALGKRSSFEVSCLESEHTMESDARKKPKQSDNVPLKDKELGKWVEGILKTWKNPVFKLTEAAIPQLIPQAPTDHVSGHGHNCAHTISEPFQEATSQTLGKLTKNGLKNAEVIAQIDKKYILVKMYGVATKDTTEENIEGGSDLIVVIDQHAADERVRVEELFQELCTWESPLEENYLLPTPTPTSATPGSLGKTLVYRVSQRESELMIRYQRWFAEWGITFDVSPIFTGPENLGKKKCTLTIKSLPRAVAERCLNEPVLAIEMVRKHIYELSENRSAHFSNMRRDKADAKKDPANQWIRKIGRCPKGLVEMLNSKACRSAIMFNDPLTLDECKVLVKKLSKCAFPFQCAHGRPSMIPLADLNNSMQSPGHDEYATKSTLASISSTDSISRTSSLAAREAWSFKRAFENWKVNGGP